MRDAGQFLSVGPWSLLLANALSGRVDQKDVAGFTVSRREDFAKRVAAVPPNTTLADLSSEQVSAVIHLASFGFKGVWGPKTTKLAALYRPGCMPVLDSQMARAFGLRPNAFTNGRQWKFNIGAVIQTIAGWLREPANARTLERLRDEVTAAVPDVSLISDVRLLDIVLWTTQDDLKSRRSTKTEPWLQMRPGVAPSLSSAAPFVINQ